MAGENTIKAAISQPNKAMPEKRIRCDQGRKATKAKTKIEMRYPRSPLFIGKKWNIVPPFSKHEGRTMFRHLDSNKPIRRKKARDFLDGILLKRAEV